MAEISDLLLGIAGLCVGSLTGGLVGAVGAYRLLMWWDRRALAESRGNSQ